MQIGGIRIRSILSLAIPMTAGMLSQSVVNLVDTAMVGHLGDQALAAVATANYALFVCFALISGISVAVQSSVAQHYGAQQWQTVLVPVAKGVQAAFVVGVPLTLLLALATPLVIALFRITPEIASLAESYFQLRILSLPAGILLLSYRGFWNGYHSPLVYLKILVAVHFLNAMASYLLIFGVGPLPAFGVDGAAIGTVFAMYSGVLINTVRLRLFAKRHKIPIPWPQDSSVTTISPASIHFYHKAWPDSLQQTLFALGTAMLFWLIAQVGTEAMAISHVLINITLLLILPGIGLGMAATTLIHQAIGAHQPELAYRWGLQVVGFAVLILTVFSLPLLLFPTHILNPFLPDNPALVGIGSLPLQLAGLAIIVESAALVLNQALLGTGCNRTVLRIRITTLWLLCLPITALGVFAFGLTLTGIWVIQIVQRVSTSLLFLKVWKKRGWQNEY